MVMKTSMALAIILAISSGASAVEKRHNGAANPSTGSQPVVRCVHGAWDENGKRCDGFDG